MNGRINGPDSGRSSQAGQRLTATWQGLAPRERRMVLLAVWVVGLSLLWWVALSPAIGTLREASVRRVQLDNTLSLMQSQAASAELIRSQNATPPPGRDAALRALEEATRQLGNGAQMSLQGDRAAVTLRDIAPGALAQWLQQVRINSRLLPVQTTIQRAGPQGWSGQIIVAGPGLAATN